ncbi:MAG TPA: DegT/DnrJ/EryC1/StrS family aminotransferase [Methylomirabilota bacterium]|nr:DegT/DnrJ/EryC1/StrS family aminotransferase [Methylomirabilota bacterium]
MTALRTIPFGRPWITEEDHHAVLSVLQSPVLTHGPQGQQFEAAFQQFLGEDCYCLTVSSCMAALHLAYLQMGIGPGDEVVVPAQTHVATVHAVEWVGARPVFVDCELHTGNLDVTRIEAVVTPRTRAIGLVHFLGMPCAMNEILAIAEHYGLKVVEDCAIALGTRYRGRHVGVFGEIGCFSFYPVKHITAGEGGMVVTRNPQVAERLSRLRAFGVDRSHSERTRPGQYDVVALGLNYRMSELQAALGCSQLRRIGEILKQRRMNFFALKSQLAALENVLVLDAPEIDSVNSHYCLSVLLTGQLARRRDELVERLKQAGIGTSVYYPQPVPRMAYYRKKYGYAAELYPHAEALSNHSIALPVGPHLLPEDIEYIATRFQHAVKEMSL